MPNRDLAWRDSHQLHRLPRPNKLRPDDGRIQSPPSPVKQVGSHVRCPSYEPEVDLVQPAAQYVQLDGRHDFCAIRWQYRPSRLAAQKLKIHHETDP